MKARTKALLILLMAFLLGAVVGVWTVITILLIQG